MLRGGVQLEQLGDALADNSFRHVVQGGVELEEFESRQPMMQAEMLREKTNPLADAVIPGGDPQQAHLTRRRGDQPKKHLYRCCFPGPVWAQETEHLAAC